MTEVKDDGPNIHETLQIETKGGKSLSQLELLFLFFLVERQDLMRLKPEQSMEDNLPAPSSILQEFTLDLSI